MFKGFPKELKKIKYQGLLYIPLQSAEVNSNIPIDLYVYWLRIVLFTVICANLFM